MGLLMFGYKEPSQERKSKEVVKNDPTATSRSAIRRPNPPPRHRQRNGNERTSGRTSPRSVRLSLSNYVVDDRDGEIVIAPRTQTTSREQRTAPLNGTTEADQRRESRGQRLEVDDYVHLRDSSRTAAWNSEQHSRSFRDHAQPVRRPAERTIRESHLRNEVHRDLGGQIDQINRQIAERAADLPRSDQGWVERNRRYWSSNEAPARIAHTQATGISASPELVGSEYFAPAYRFNRPSEHGMPSWAPVADRRSRSPSQRPQDGYLDTASNGVANPGFPPLERQSARGSLVELRASTPRHNINRADGLGDRRRSVSPNDEAWETIMTTIAQDERLPSAESSFTSATASASFSSRVESNPTTSATSPSLANAVGNNDLPDRDCDDDGAGLQTPNSLPDSGPDGEDGTALRRSVSRNRVPSMNLDGGDSPEPSLSFEEARRELEREIETYTRSRTQQVLGNFLNRGESVPEELWQALIPRNLLAGASEVLLGTVTGERSDSN